MFGHARAPRYAYRSAVLGSLPRSDAERIMGSGLSCKGIHLPDDPSPRTLDASTRDFWDQTHQNARGYYGAKNDKLAQTTAWKTTRLFFDRGHDGRYQRRHPVLPFPGTGTVTALGDPGDLVGLGVCVEYTYIWRSPGALPNPAGHAATTHRHPHAAVHHHGRGGMAQPMGIPHLGICKFPENDPPTLYWSPSTASLYIFPGTDATMCQTPDPWSAAAAVYKTWSQRDARCERILDVPEVDVQLIGNLDTIVYRDDKWHDYNADPHKKGSQEYIHQFGEGVGLWQSAGDPPSAIVMTGGCLELDPRGLIH